MGNLIIRPTLSPQTKRPINLILYKYRCKTKPFTGIYQNQYFSYFFFIMTTTKDCTWSRTVQQPSCQRQRSGLDQILEVAGEGREKEGSTAHPISAEPCLQADCQLELRKELKKAKTRSLNSMSTCGLQTHSRQEPSSCHPARSDTSMCSCVHTSTHSQGS